MRSFIFIFVCFIFYSKAQSQITLNESMGTVSANTAILTHQNNGGFEQDQWLYSGDADIRATTASPGGGANVFITNVPNRSFRLDNLSGSGCAGLTLQFRIHKNGGASNPLTINEFFVQVSSNGTDFTDIDWGGHNLGGVWTQTPEISIPTNTIAIRFMQPVVPDQQVRIDDITIVGSGPCDNPLLPVTFAGITAERKNNEVEVQFSTASEVNNDYFTIERSTDGLSFEEAGRIQGAGHSDRLIKYSFTDVAPKSGINYYRVRQTDYDGAFAHSDVVKVCMPIKAITWDFTTDGNTIRVLTQEVNLMVRIVDATGRNMLTVNNLTPGDDIYIGFLPVGMYFLEFSGDHFRETKRMIKP